MTSRAASPTTTWLTGSGKVTLALMAAGAAASAPAPGGAGPTGHGISHVHAIASSH